MFAREWEPAQQMDAEELNGAFGEEHQPRRVLPDGIEEMPPGPELGEILEGLDSSRLNGHELVTVIQARARQIAHLQADLYADIWELAHTPPCDIDSPPERTELVDEYIREEVQAALTLTGRAADHALSLACDLDRLPPVREALGEGRIDLARARVICRELEHLDDDLALQVVDELLDDAPRLTTSQIGRRLRRRCHKLDPDNTARRYHKGVEERHVHTQTNPDGTADISARQLPIERVAAITSRIRALAQQLKGHDERSIDQIRADIVLDLLEGNTILPQTSQKGSVQLHVDLETLLRLNDEPGELEGFGPIISDLARRLTHDLNDGSWTAVVTDKETGQPIWNATLRRRPTANQRRHIQARNPTCVFPGCNRPATQTQIDHIIDHARGGPTHPANLGPLCTPHHLRTKHRAGWKLAQPKPGHFHWISPRHHHYHVRPPPPD